MRFCYYCFKDTETNYEDCVICGLSKQHDTNFDEKLLKDYEIYGTAIYKITIDKDNNIIKELIDINDISKEDYKELKIVEYFRRKNETKG